jgi:TonB-dependent starch-binding outer membrane protein SusC
MFNFKTFKFMIKLLLIGNSYAKNYITKKLLIVMKLITSLMFLATLQISAGVYSQNAKLNLSFKSGTLADIIDAIESQSDYKIFYKTNQVDVHKEVSLNQSDGTIASVLNKALNGSDITYHVLDKLIVLIPTKEIQQNIITGKVTDADGQPIPGVNIIVEGTTIGVTTDMSGNYRIEVPSADASLAFSFLGYTTERTQINGRKEINITLKPDVKNLDEVVVVGYGTVRRTDLTGSVSSIKSGDIKAQGDNTIQKALQGRMSGVEVESAGGNPGSGVRVLIRGTGTINNNDPLYIVDGVAVDNINNLAVSDISSLDILKDASAAAIYGSRAANGVVLVTTKSGKKGETTKIEFNTYVGSQKLAKKLDLLNAQQWATVSNAAYAAASQPGLPMAADPASLGAGTDWQNEIFRTSPIQNYDLSVNGGSDNFNYSVSGAYLNQKGIVKVTGYDRWNLRVKSEYSKGRIKIGETVIYSNEYQQNMAGGWGGQGGNPVGSAAKMIPIFKVYDPTAIGGYGGAYGDVVNIANPVAQLNLEKITVTTNTALVNLFAELKLVDNLKYKFNVGYTNTSGYNYDFTNPYTVGTLFVHSVASLSESRNQTQYLLQEHTLSYDKTFGKHSVNAVAGFTFEDKKYRSLSGSKNGMPSVTQVLDAGSSSTASGSYAYENALVSYFGRLVYSFDNRYVLTATLRNDKSSKFAENNRSGYFPSLALAWNVSREKFFEPLQSIVSELKIRGSYGVLGNQELPGDLTNSNGITQAIYPYVPVISTNANYVIGTGQSLMPGSIQAAFANPQIKWETSKTSNIGVDWGFFKNKLTLSTDYFVKKTTDIIIAVPIPPSTGASANPPAVNAGDITNKGFEASLAFQNQTGDFTYGINATVSAYSNEVTSLGSGAQKIYAGQPTHHGNSSTVTQAGYPIGAFYLIKTDGIFNSQAEVDNYTKNGTKIQPLAQPGDVRFVDYNDDGQIDQNDRQYLGSPTPKLSYGFGANAAWKGIDINLFLQGTYGNKIYNGLREDLEGMNVSYNWSATTLNAWTPANHSDIPRAVFGDPNYNDQTSDRFLESGSYLRLKTVQLGYTLPKSIISKVKMTNCRIYLSFDNLFTITKYKGYNPDLGRTGSILDRGVDFGHVAYPLAKTYILGLQLTF